MTVSVQAKPAKGHRTVRFDLIPSVSRRSIWQEGADFKVSCRDYWIKHRLRPKAEEIMKAEESPTPEWFQVAAIHAAIARMRALESLF